MAVVRGAHLHSTVNRPATVVGGDANQRTVGHSSSPCRLPSTMLTRARPLTSDPSGLPYGGRLGWRDDGGVAGQLVAQPHGDGLTGAAEWASEEKATRWDARHASHLVGFTNERPPPQHSSPIPQRAPRALA